MPPSESELNRFYPQLDGIPVLRGAGVGYIGDGACTVLRRDFHSSGLKTYVILDVADSDSPATPTPAAVPPPPSIGLELAGVGLNCSGAVLSWVALGAEGAAAPVSGGASLALTVLTWSAAIATTAQCANSVVRSADILVHHGEWTRWLDSSDFYNWSMNALDAVSLAGAAAAGALTVKAVLAMRRATGKGVLEALKGLNRAERKRLTRELIQMQRPGISNTAVKQLVRAGTFPARFSAVAIQQGLFNQLRDAISATLSFGSSAASGVLKLIYVHIYQE